MDERCDQFPNCADSSDEANCHLVVKLDTYVSYDAPFTIDQDKKLVKVPVQIGIDLIRILSINEVGQIFGNQFNLIMTWYDFRLKFHNMKENINMNTLSGTEKQGIWVPKLVLSNTEEKVSTKNDEKAFTLARRESAYDFSDGSMLDNAFVFEGEKNPFVLSRVYNVDWLCEYDMRWYPFDTQSCTMLLEVSARPGSPVPRWRGTPACSSGSSPASCATSGPRTSPSTSFGGSPRPSSLLPRETNMSLTEAGEVAVEVVLGRRLLGTVLTVYIPTILLVVISYMSNFFKAFFFEAIVAVNLTVMLVCVNLLSTDCHALQVMATMFISVSENLPKTSYIKMIDIWLIFNLLVPFFEVAFLPPRPIHKVLLHTLIDNLRVDEDREVNNHGKPRKVVSSLYTINEPQVGSWTAEQDVDGGAETALEVEDMAPVDTSNFVSRFEDVKVR
jgi:hypothetical protein